MTNFVYKLNGNVVKPNELTDAVLRGKFDQMRSKISDALGSRRCPVHDLEPILFLESDGSNVRVTGFTSCCKQSGADVHKRLEDLKELAGMEFTVTVKTMNFDQK